MTNSTYSISSVSDLSPPAVDDRLDRFPDDLECVLRDTHQNGLNTSFPQIVQERKGPVDIDEGFEEDYEEGSGDGSEVDYEEGVEEEFEDSDDSDSDSGEVSVTTWVPPKIHAGHLEYTIWKMMPFEEHEIYDELIVHLFEACKGPWPSYEEILSDVKLASSILLLVVATACPGIPLKPQWRVSENVAVLAEQDILREKLAMSVLGKSFEKLRSLGFWYDGY